MNVRVLAAAGVGIIVLGCILASRDLASMLAAVSTLGWQGALGLVAWRSMPVGCCVLALWILLPRRDRATLLASLQSRMTRDGVAALLPVLPAGGELVGARVLTLAGIATTAAVAVQVVDLTLELIAQVGFSLVGVGAWLKVLPVAAFGGWSALAIALPVLMVVGLRLMQHPTLMQWLATTARRLVKHSVSASALAAAIHTIYASRGRVTAGLGLHFGGWIIGIGEAWFALRWMGHPLSMVSVLVLEAVVFAVKGAAFAVPWSVGIQEGGYLALGVALGLPADVAVSLALVKRLPDLVLGLPSLVWWQGVERRIGQRRQHPIQAPTTRREKPPVLNQLRFTQSGDHAD